MALARVQPLPVVPVPLLPGDADVALELQPALTTICDVIGCDERLDYEDRLSGH
jgi:hypothetical protein